MMTWCDLTDRFPMTFDVQRMREEYESLAGASWLEHYDRGLSRDWRAVPLVSLDGKVENANSLRASYDQSRMKRTSFVDKLPYFREILDAFQCPHGRIRILKLEPGAAIAPHRDIRKEVANIAFGKVRLHVPIYTNDRVFFFVGKERLQMQPGRLYYVNFSKKHHVRNDGDKARVHLVMDLHANEWLTQFFPPFSLAERVQNAATRFVLPIEWQALKYQVRLRRWFWRCYNGSKLQGIKRRVFS